MSLKNASTRATLTAACCLLAGIAHAQTPAESLLQSSWVFNLGAFIHSSDLKGNLNGESGTNPEVDFDESFGRDNDATRVRADVLWRITPTHHLRFMYFENSSERTRVLNEDVAWGDHLFEAGANVTRRNEFQIAELAYEYAFAQQRNYEIAGSIGVHYMDWTLNLSGAATITDDTGTRFESAAVKKSSVGVPLPVIGVRAGWAAMPNLYLEAQAQFFKAKFGDYDGRLFDFRAGGTWMFTKNWGLGLGYNRFVTTVEVEKDSFDGKLRLGYGGLQAFLTAAF